ncbi:MAG: FtsX-like permease family protein, partial [Abditibacteriales bacterium]|nr:FtsX-like permease family protein [Abditibacteriales bacterium]
MNIWRFITRSLRFYWRAHLGVLLGATLSTAILVGALAVGDSVRFSLRAFALARLGNVHLALNGQSRFFREKLAEEISSALKANVAPIILLRGTAVGEGNAPTGSAGASPSRRVQVVGVDKRFWEMGNAKAVLRSDEEAVALNERLAQQLGAKVGDEVLLRVDKPSLLSRDAPLSTVEDASVALRLPVAAIVSDADFGRFSLEANQMPPFTAFVPLTTLQQKIALRGRANVLLVGGDVPLNEASIALARQWQLADASLELRALPQHNALELRTDRVFLDPPVGKAAMDALPGAAQGVLTYFVNEIRNGERATPYSTVAALETGKLGNWEIKEDEVVINQWLADDLHAKVGDRLQLKYFVVGAMRRLEERTSAFRVKAIVPMTGAAVDPDLMPAIPGLTDKKNCRDWEPGVPIDLEKIRDKDEDYWDKYRGTPKAFITLKAGQRIWNNRFGNLTAVRYPMDKLSRGVIEVCIKQRLNPASIGLFFVPVREQALKASEQALNLGWLFLGFSFFLIIAALLLTALLFAFGVEQRAEEVGTLLAVGFQPKHVQRLLLLEGAAIAFIAGGIGAAAGVFYTQAMIWGLSSVWSGAVAQAALQFHAEPKTLAIGAAAGFIVAVFSIYLITRQQARAPARELLTGVRAEGLGLRVKGSQQPSALNSQPFVLYLTIVPFIGAIALVLFGLRGGQEQAASVFFGAGALLLTAGIAACRLLLSTLNPRPSALNLRMTLTALGMRNTTRRAGRSVAIVAMLACGSFMVIAVGANRHDPQEGAEKRSSGTGGFAFYGETALPVYHDLNSAEGREFFGLEEGEVRGVRFVPLRLRGGDEASCLNLNRAQTPRVLGVDPQALSQRKAFTFVKTLRETTDGWALLTGQEPDGAVPAVGDANTVTWSLGKKLGDTLIFLDDSGNEFKVRIVGILANSILQGGLIISEENFIRRFPSQAGYQVFLIDAPRSAAASRATLAHVLTRALEDVGLDLTPASERLTMFKTVENTYLSIFAVLGGLGLLLGSAGLGVVVL